ncbi:MAG TPA: biotin synthase BioB, partial [Myxococcota bacterium]|nr:biotin synthase BioB [Myxococcota bacterium]
MNIADYLSIRSTWQYNEIQEIFEKPLVDLLHIAHSIHRNFHNPHEIQPCRIQSIKTGACPEDCKYCPQSGHYQTNIEKERLFSVEKAVNIAKDAKACGATRFCMGVAWRQVLDGEQFDRILAMVKAIDELGLEVCLTAGMMTKEQAIRLNAAGCTAYNHNLDTSPEFYGQIITTRTYQDRLDTIRNVRAAGITVCSGGIIGLGEARRDRIGLLEQLSNLDPHPESVPINLLAKYDNMPLNDVPPPHPFEMVRMVATARVIMPKSVVRLSAGRTAMTDELHALCYYAGANSIFMATEK